MSDNCQYCLKGSEIDYYAEFLIGLDNSIVYLYKDSNYPGRCVVAAKDHLERIYKQPDSFSCGFMNEVFKVARAIEQATGADNVNIATYGDGVTHIHFHLTPKVKGGPQWGTAFIVDRFNAKPPQAQPMTKQQIAEYKKKILERLT